MNTDILQAGDHLLYKGSGLFSHLIRIKTWSPVSHIEIYLGDGISYASRDGKGVNFYFLREEGLTHILRPLGKLDVEKARKWAEGTVGQRYDWKGLLCFTLAVKQGAVDKMFCSEAATRFDRAGGFNPFHQDWDADHIAPGNFLMVPSFEHVPF